jgi:hypothetical protein
MRRGGRSAGRKDSDRWLAFTAGYQQEFWDNALFCFEQGLKSRMSTNISLQPGLTYDFYEVDL